VTDSIELEVRSSSSGNGGGSNGGGNNGENNGGGDGGDIESDEEVRANFLYSLSLASSLAIISIAALVRRFDTNCP
jgi:hypothetical protein